MQCWFSKWVFRAKLLAPHLSPITYFPQPRLADAEDGAVVYPPSSTLTLSINFIFDIISTWQWLLKPHFPGGKQLYNLKKAPSKAWVIDLEWCRLGFQLPIYLRQLFPFRGQHSSGWARGWDFKMRQHEHRSLRASLAQRDPQTLKFISFLFLILIC